MIRLILLLASGLGAGFSPFAPGTAGTLVAIPIELVLSPIRSPVYELTILTFFFLQVVWVLGFRRMLLGRPGHWWRFPSRFFFPPSVFLSMN